MILSGKVALVTGSSRGIGAAIAKVLAEHGASLVINYLQNKAKAQEVLREIQRGEGCGIVVQGDVSSKEDVERIVETTLRKFSKIDILVNNAHRPFLPKSFIDLVWQDVEEQIQGTVRSAFYCSHAVLKGMIEQKSGKIINVLSVSLNDPDPGFYSRNIAKAALVGLTRTLAQEVGAFGITINMIAPGWTLTEQAEKFSHEYTQRALARTPLGRLATPEDVARAVLFYASDLSGFVTGSYLPVCGGAVMI